MLNYIILFLTISLTGCKEINSDTKKNTIAVDSTENEYSKTLKQREQASSEKQNDNIGNLISTISFEVKTDNIKDFKNGFIPYANLEKPEQDLSRLVDKNETVIKDTAIEIIIDYPLTNAYKFDLFSEKGFTRAHLLKEISRHYFILYDEEEKTATIKTIPIDKRTKMYNRNETNGKYGVWGHDIADLVLTEIQVYRTASGQLVLTLEIES